MRTDLYPGAFIPSSATEPRAAELSSSALLKTPGSFPQMSDLPLPGSAGMVALIAW